jgi:hypothetical protein
MCAHTGMPRLDQEARRLDHRGAALELHHLRSRGHHPRGAAEGLLRGLLEGAERHVGNDERAELPRATHWTWYSVCSSVTGRVESCPWITIPRESPMSSMSTPASSEMRAKLAS